MKNITPEILVLATWLGLILGLVGLLWILRGPLNTILNAVDQGSPLAIIPWLLGATLVMLLDLHLRRKK